MEFKTRFDVGDVVWKVDADYPYSCDKCGSRSYNESVFAVKAATITRVGVGVTDKGKKWESYGYTCGCLHSSFSHDESGFFATKKEAEVECKRKNEEAE